MNDISQLSGAKKLTSQLKVSLQSTQKKAEIEPSQESKELQSFAVNLQEFNDALKLAAEIRVALEKALSDLNS